MASSSSSSPSTSLTKTPSPEELSAIFREMYEIPDGTPVFDRVRLWYTSSHRNGLGGGSSTYWVHVVNTPAEWTAEVERDQQMAFPEGFNNVVDVVSNRYSANPDAKLVYMHYRPCAPGLPEDF